MNKSSHALVWELWRKNRWGFILLVLLLALCAGGAQHLTRLQSDVRRLQRNFVTSTQGSLPLKQVLPFSLGGSSTAALVKIKLGGKLIYNGSISPADVLSWSGDDSDASWATMSVFLNTQPLTLRTALAPQLSVSVSNGAKRSISFAPAFDFFNALTDAASRASEWQIEIYIGCLVSIALSVLITFALFGLAESNPVRGFTGVPPRLFTLPVPTSHLVMWPVVLGAATIALLSLAYFGWLLPLVSLDARLSPTYFTALFTTSLAVSQMLIWSLPAYPRARIALLTFVMFALVVFAAVGFGQATSSSSEIRLFQQIVEGSCLFIWLGAAGLALLGVRLERQGHWTGRARSRHLTNEPGAVYVPATAFRSGIGAQVWIEWRRNGRLALLIWAAGLGVILIGSLFGISSQEHRWVSEALLTAGVVTGICWVGLIGLNLGRDAASKSLAMSSFMAVRPLTTGQLFEAKLVIGGGLWVCAVFLLAIVGLISAAIAGQFQEVDDYIYAAIVFTAISLHVAVGILPFCLTGRLPGFPWSLLPLLLMYGAIIDSLYWLNTHPRFLIFLFPLLTLLLLLKLICAFWAFRKALLLQLASISFVLAYCGLWLAVAGGLVCIAFLSYSRMEVGSEMIALLPAAALIVPLARIAFSPLAFAANRHR